MAERHRPWVLDAPKEGRLISGFFGRLCPPPFADDGAEIYRPREKHHLQDKNKTKTAMCMYNMVRRRLKQIIK